MPCTTRAIQTGGAYHVFNRGNGRTPLFHRDADLAAFEPVRGDGLKHHSVDVLTGGLLATRWSRRAGSAAPADRRGAGAADGELECTLRKAAQRALQRNNQ